jgi:hypothetical protein
MAMDEDYVLYFHRDGTSERMPRSKLPEDAVDKHLIVGASFYEDAMTDPEDLEVWTAPGATVPPREGQV